MMIPLIRCPYEKKIEICVAEDDGNPEFHKNIYIAEVSVEQAKELLIRLAVTIDIMEKDVRRCNLI